MSTRFMPEEKALLMHLLFHPPIQGIHIFSGFAAALRDARKVTGRNINTGDKLSGVLHGSWLGALGYMTLLDQIGKCFKPKSKPVISDGSAIFKALRYFTNLSEDEINAIYALRNAFAHDFSLYNRHPGGNQNFTHRFMVITGTNGPLVKLPKLGWDGDYNNMIEDNCTVINLELFGDLMESICNDIFVLANSRQLEIMLSGGADELISRYSIFSR
jgi:hypothetical protein